MSRPHVLPRSAAHPFVYAFGVACFIAAMFYCRHSGLRGVNATLLAVAAYGLSIMLVEVLVLRLPKDPAQGLDFSRFHFSLARSAFKLVGVYASFGFIAFLYWLFPEYHFNFFPQEGDTRGFYIPYSDALRLVLPWVLGLAIPYVALLDAVMAEPEDRYYQLGRKLLRRSTAMTRAGLIQHVLEWLARGYFLALLFVYADREFNALILRPALSPEAGVAELYQAAFAFIFTLGLVIAISGNTLALRLTGTHVRSTDPTLFGWWICLVCFQPFLSFLELYFLLPGQHPWIEALEAYPFYLGVWAALLLFALCAGITADVTLGNRYGQLSHRGLVTNGLYRYTKHPSYLATVLFLLVAWMPPLVAEDGRVLEQWAAISGMALVYFLRARTEERHLSRDPAYVEYALWMNNHGLLRKLGQWVPFFRYVPPGGMKPAPDARPYAGLAYS